MKELLHQTLKAVSGSGPAREAINKSPSKSLLAVTVTPAEKVELKQTKEDTSNEEEERARIEEGKQEENEGLLEEEQEQEEGDESILEIDLDSIQDREL